MKEWFHFIAYAIMYGHRAKKGPRYACYFWSGAHKTVPAPEASPEKNNAAREKIIVFFIFSDQLVQNCEDHKKIRRIIIHRLHIQTDK